jgi:NADP-dependent 3-hydroxy acid dehydrogenase YdfG
MNKPAKVMVFGATSSIAYETLKYFASDGASLYLCGRDEEELKRISDDLTVRGAKEARYASFDALNEASITSAINNCLETYPDLDCLFIAYGILPDQKLCEMDADELKKALDINFTSAAGILIRMATHFEKQGRGTIAVISSVAGDRGRQSNYVYGSAKGALTVFAAGLRQRLSKSGVNVVTIKPGFVDTPMTRDFKKGLLFVGPDVVGRAIYDAILKGKGIVYLPWFWRWIMLIIKSIPEMIFKKISL